MNATHLTRPMAGFGIVLIASLLLPGCQSIPLQGGINDRGEKVYLSEKREIPDAIAAFAKSQDLESEEGRINYLLQRVRNSKLTYIRNNECYTNAEAAEFLRWKMHRPRWEPLVHTARDFVIIVSGGSMTSGLPYHAVFSATEHRELKAILINELDFLEEFLKEQKAAASATPAVQSEQSQVIENK